MSTKRKRETWTIGKDAPIDVDSEGAGDPIEHQKQVARALYEKRKQQGSYGASDNDDAAGLHVVVLSSDEYARLKEGKQLVPPFVFVWEVLYVAIAQHM